jgi:hypothetical protein
MASASEVQIGGGNALVNKPEMIQQPTGREIVVNECFGNYGPNWRPAERNLYLPQIDSPDI